MINPYEPTIANDSNSDSEKKPTTFLKAFYHVGMATLSASTWLMVAALTYTAIATNQKSLMNQPLDRKIEFAVGILSATGVSIGLAMYAIGIIRSSRWIMSRAAVVMGISMVVLTAAIIFHNLF